MKLSEDRLVDHILFIMLIFSLFISCNNLDKIDRDALVKRHFPTLTKADSLSPFTVGNGEFAFTADVTGLQTFPNFYNNGIPLGTHSQWGWHSIPNDNNYNFEQTLEEYQSRDRIVKYGSNQSSHAGKWLRENPHRLHLGRIGFDLKKSDGADVKIIDIIDIHQSVDLWDGIIKSSFRFENNNIYVETACHPKFDQVAVSITSKHLLKGNTSIKFEFPYGSLDWGKNSTDWESNTKHSTEIIKQNLQHVLLKRILDTTIYYTSINWIGNGEFIKVKDNKFLLKIKSGDKFEFTSHFIKEKNKSNNVDAAQTFAASVEHWGNFWETGGAIDLSESSDSRANELERRIILSRYLTAVQCAGTLPPSETGLTFNSWYGKFHLEMHWWHGVHFVLWNKPTYFEKSLVWYSKILPEALKKAESQGYDGVRWPKMVGPYGNDSPSLIGVFLIWQQPHPIYYAELLFKYYKRTSILEQYKDIVFNTADFMASYPTWDEKNQRYVLGPPLIPAQEIYKPDSTINPAFELAYWRFGLSTAQKWRERLGLKRNEKWDDVLQNLSDIPVNNGYYQNAENSLNTFEDESNRNDHPTMLGIFGMLPSKNIDHKILIRTLEKVFETWNWDHTWGWDYPLVAMTAARVGRPDLAIDALLMDTQKNIYLLNGHNYQNNTLPIYLPGNGGLLSAVAMMAAGWEDAPNINAPGFPQDGKWIVKYESIMPLP